MLIERETFVRIRTAAGTVGPDRRYQPGSETRTEFSDGSFQPVSSQDAETLPEGDRQRAELRLYSQADLRGDRTSDQIADRIEYKGSTYPQYQNEEFEVRTVEKREALIPGSKYILLRVQEP